ncbi:MAG: Fic/DOC family protein [bacterium ADurb.Bin400]|nr:MAG: Fic/DOC family protein [bacterium ADurb.Bin400]
MDKLDLIRDKVVIYGPSASGPKLEVKLENETIWLTQSQMVQLFGKNVRTISEHINNIYTEGELKKGATIRKFRIVQNENGRSIERSIEHYNLDVVISVGYRVKSKEGTQFRIWANRVLRDYLVRGYALNQSRLAEQAKSLKELQSAIKFLYSSSKYALLDGQQSRLLGIVNDYATSLTILHQYDEGTLTIAKSKKAQHVLRYEECCEVIQILKKRLREKREAGDLFGQEYSGRFAGILGNIYQSYGGAELYDTIAEKAAHLLYFVIKDHPFFDGNKRIASLLFAYYLERNQSRKIEENTLVALALLIAISEPKDKDVMIKIITNLIKD